MLMEYRIHCQRTGLLLGKLEYEVIAGHMPYLSHWDKMVAIHPLFSLPTNKLLAHSRALYDKIASGAGEDSEKKEEQLRVCFLAILHTLDCIKQEAVALPPLHIVQSQMPRLFVLAYWKYYLDSKRFCFPEFKINKLNSNDRFENIKFYIDACFQVKEDYENGVKDLAERAKIASTERAMIALRNAWIVPVSRKELWRWVRAHLPEKYQADAEGWMGTMFLGNDKAILDFDVDEAVLMQGIIEGECPQGTPILAAVRERINYVIKTIKDTKEAFDVDYEQIEPAGEQATPQPEPKQKDFPNIAAFIKARAIWYLQSKKAGKQS